MINANDFMEENEECYITRLFCKDLADACEALDEAFCDYDLDSGDRIMSNDIERAMEILENAGIDFDGI